MSCLVNLFLAALCCTAVVMSIPAQRKSYDAHLGMSLNDSRVLNRNMACPPDCPADCKDLRDMGNIVDGAYIIYISTDFNRPLPVYCDMTTSGGGWLVFQRRATGIEDFYRNWNSYVNGFGTLSAEFWLGNYDLSLLLAQKYYRLRIDMTNYFNGAGYAEYNFFRISACEELNKYSIAVSGFQGNVGDSLSGHGAHKFSTFDQDNNNDATNRAQFHHSAWWHGGYALSNLNGLYGNNGATNISNVYWYSWRNDYTPLKEAEMKFRPQ